MARARLHDRHQLSLKRKLQRIKHEQGIYHAPVSAPSTVPKPKEHEQVVRDEADQDDEDELDSFEDLENKCLRDYEEGRYSPFLAHLNELDLESQKRCTDETDDWDKLKQQRESVIKSGSVKVGSRKILYHSNPSLVSLARCGRCFRSFRKKSRYLERG